MQGFPQRFVHHNTPRILGFVVAVPRYLLSTALKAPTERHLPVPIRSTLVGPQAPTLLAAVVAFYLICAVLDPERSRACSELLLVLDLLFLDLLNNMSTTEQLFRVLEPTTATSSLCQAKPTQITAAFFTLERYYRVVLSVILS